MKDNLARTYVLLKLLYDYRNVYCFKKFGNIFCEATKEYWCNKIRNLVSHKPNNA